MSKLVFVMDLGTFKAFRLDDSPSFSKPRLVSLAQQRSQVEDRISDLVTDQAGQFPKGSRSFAAVSDMSNGERHNLDLEYRRRALKAFARFAAQVHHDHPMDSCYLAAPAEIHPQVLEALPADIQGSIDRNLRRNLTNLNDSEIVDHFCAKT